MIRLSAVLLPSPAISIMRAYFGVDSEHEIPEYTSPCARLREKSALTLRQTLVSMQAFLVKSMFRVLIQ